MSRWSRVATVSVWVKYAWHHARVLRHASAAGVCVLDGVTFPVGHEHNRRTWSVGMTDACIPLASVGRYRRVADRLDAAIL
ncbi:hypothetical protein HMPREF9622_00668 [Cutibacterium modestum HL037PA3]|nr:hypothetical protein HMPREF9622_00668 [Cutibacterium modestum HL037PA3]